jgi:hypothetical protein
MQHLTCQASSASSGRQKAFGVFPSFPDVLPVLVKSEKAWAEEDAQAKLALFCIILHPFISVHWFHIFHSLLIDSAQHIPDALFAGKSRGSCPQQAGFSNF